MTRIIALSLSLALCAFLFWNTGLHGDDYSVIVARQGMGARDFLNPHPGNLGTMIFNITSYYGLWWAYPLWGFDQQPGYDVVKAAVHLLGILFVFLFAADYLPPDRAWLAAFLFVLYPIHDSANYWYMILPYFFVPTLLLLGHSLIRHDRILSGVSVSLVGAFATYASPPYVFGLAAIFAFERKFRKACLFAAPGLAYVAYYLGVKAVFSGVENRINAGLGLGGFLRHLLLQPLSLLDATVGPSFWCKAYFAGTSLRGLSAIFAVALLALLWFKAPSFSPTPAFPRSLFLGFACVLLLACGMFALTGFYAHSPFNLGNRTTIYGSLCVGFLLALIPLNRKTVWIPALLVLLPALGLSDHWKSWNAHQKAVIEGIQANPALARLASDSTLLVTGNLYSSLGPFSHIDFFAVPWVLSSICRGHVGSRQAIPLTSFMHLQDGILADPKFGQEYPLTGKLFWYDSLQGSLQELAPASVSQLVADQPREVRHWIQLAKGTSLASAAVFLSPRLAYLFR